jgi:hypothetical protein
MDVDQLLRHRRHVGEHAEPAERVDPLVEPERRGRQALARNPVEAVAAGDEIALDLPGDAPGDEADPGLSRVEIVQCHIERLIDDFRSRGLPTVH